jgi:hypothetical protein
LIILNHHGTPERSALLVLKYIKATFKVKDNADVYVKMALKRGVTSGALIQVKGTGASGSFKVKKPKKAKAASRRRKA